MPAGTQVHRQTVNLTVFVHYSTFYDAGRVSAADSCTVVYRLSVEVLAMKHGRAVDLLVAKGVFLQIYSAAAS